MNLQRLLTVAVVALLMSLSPSFAQNSTPDISGTWVGTRMQYDWAKLNYIQTFDYIFEIEQDGNLISGTSFISNDNDDYAEIKIRGSIVGDVLYFEEYEVVSEDRPDKKVWCFKVGSLKLIQSEGTLSLDGDTESFTSIGFFPCSGGTTHLEKLMDYGSQDPGNYDDPVVSNPGSNDFSLTAFPNPYMDKAIVKYTIEERADVTLEVFSIAGQKVTELVNETQEASTYSYTFNGKQMGLPSGAYIVKLTVGEQVASQQIIQMN
jgi:hypothetical protein